MKSDFGFWSMIIGFIAFMLVYLTLYYTPQ